MSDQATSEPTMEEILASIRRIISEDDAPADGTPTPEVQSAASDVDLDADVLELSEPLPPIPEPEPLVLKADPLGDLDLIEIDDEPFEVPAPAAVAEVALPVAAPASGSAAFRTDIEGLVAPKAASAAASAFSRLSGSVSMPKDSTSLDDVVRELLRPLLKQWLDDNLARIVEAKVEQEVQRIARNSL